MIQINDKANCCGCTACASVCAHDAITMQPDVMGFLYPIVDKSKCVDCGLCEKVCAFNDHYDTSLNLPDPKAYAARHKDIQEVETSRSGAAFIAISDYVLENGGVVYGAGYTDHFRVIHKRATNKEERNEFKGSKYVQSDMNTIFRQVKNDLKNGITVLFSGTPCQTAGLNSYVGEKLRKHLILIDIICHGVPSPYIWHDYINYIEKKYNKKITKVDFRDKSRVGWSKHIESFMFQGEKIESQMYTKLFYKHIMFRQSCGECYYTNLQRPSDITIGDLWGWEKLMIKFNEDNKGCSLVITNTSLGKLIFDKISNKTINTQININDFLQPNLIKPSHLSRFSNKFARTYHKKGFNYAYNKYINKKEETLIHKIINKIKNIAK